MPQSSHASVIDDDTSISQAAAERAGHTKEQKQETHQKKQAGLEASIAKLNETVQADIQDLQTISADLNLGNGGQSIEQALIQPLQTSTISALEEALQDYEKLNQGLFEKVQQANQLGKALDETIDTQHGGISLREAKLNLGTERIIRNYIKAKKQENELTALKSTSQ